jgi:hypothetical protein
LPNVNGRVAARECGAQPGRWSAGSRPRQGLRFRGRGTTLAVRCERRASGPSGAAGRAVVETMTQVAEPGSARRRRRGASAVGAVHHWIRRTDRGGHLRPPVVRSTTRRRAKLAREVDFATADEVGAAGRGGEGAAISGLAANVTVEADRDPVPDPEPRRDASQGAGRPPDRRARQGPSDALGEIAAWPREPGVRNRASRTC